MNLKVFPLVLATIGYVTPFSVDNNSNRAAQKVAPLLMSESNVDPSISRRNAVFSALLPVAAAMSVATVTPQPAFARLEAVNRPDLLPSEAGANVIQTERFLTNGQAKRLDTMLGSLEKDTGFRVRVLCQSYPNTPGLAIRDYWDLAKEVSVACTST
jgi:hypothetical protein